MKLKELMQGVGVLRANADMNMEITDVVYDSRKVSPGCLFVAITGFATDGNLYIPQALQKGAAAVVTARPQEGDVPYVLVESDRLALAGIGGNYYGHPAENLKLVGVTGTNGKTSVTLLLKHILETVLGAKVGLIGTMGNWIGDETLPTERTTPESFELQGLLANMRSAGCGYAVMEVSSHAITLERVGGLWFEAAAFTNLTEDHLDFHGTMEAYGETKAKLFARCGKAAVNMDDPWAERMLKGASCEVLKTSAMGEADLYAKDVRLLPDGVRFTAVCGEKQAQVALGIPGRFSVYNALTALSLAVLLDVPLEQAALALGSAKGVRGRVEVVPTPGMHYTVLIDYAHTPDGLENVLRSVRDFCEGRVIAVFGCGGDRDPKKRPIMGKIGTELADWSIITSDNPRSEEPMAIIADILAGAEGKNYEVIENRPDAIRKAMDIGKKNDIIVLAGKGHETYQEVCGIKRHMDEREIVAAYLKETREENG